MRSNRVGAILGPGLRPPVFSGQTNTFTSVFAIAAHKLGKSV